MYTMRCSSICASSLIKHRSNIEHFSPKTVLRYNLIKTTEIIILIGYRRKQMNGNLNSLYLRLSSQQQRIVGGGFCVSKMTLEIVIIAIIKNNRFKLFTMFGSTIILFHY